MAVKNNLQVSNITFQGTQNTSASSSTSSAPKNINMTDNTAEQELLKRLGITKEQLETIQAKYSDFLSLSPENKKGFSVSSIVDSGFFYLIIVGVVIIGEVVISRNSYSQNRGFVYN